MKNLATDKFAVLFRDPSQRQAWNVTSNFDTPQRAVEAAEAFRSQNIEAYPVNLRLVVEHVPDFILSQVERSLEAPPTHRGRENPFADDLARAEAQADPKGNIKRMGY